MNSQKNQGAMPSPILQDLQAEVTAETAPLLQFIVKNANLIISIVVLFLLTLAITGIWQWYNNKETTNALNSLVDIELNLQRDKKSDALKDLETFTKQAPSSIHLYSLMLLAQAQNNQNKFNEASETYSQIAREDADGAIGLIAMFDQASSLLNAKQYAEALKILQTLEDRLPAESRSPQLRQIIGETALLAGQKDLAIKTYQALSREVQGLDGEYFRSRAENIEKTK